jgi:hypothetical protein
MADRLDNGHVLTDEDVDAARLIKELNDALGRTTDAVTLRIANTPPDRVQPVAGQPPKVHRVDPAGGDPT